MIGGCHVTGYGIGDAPPFWTELVRRWGTDRVDVHGQVSLTRAREIIRSLAPLGSGTLVILQMGHHDVWKELALLNPLTAGNDRKLRRQGGSLSSATENKAPPPGGPFWLSLCRAFLRGTVLAIADKVLIRRVDWQNGIRRLDEQFQALASELTVAGAEEVIVLSAFPTISPRLNLHRAAVSGVLKSGALKNGFCFVDVWKVLATGKGTLLLPRRSTVLDTVHLNVNGHACVAQALERQAMVPADRQG